LYAKSARSIDGYTKFNINHFVYFSITTWHFFYHSSFNHNWLCEYCTYRMWTDATVKRARVYYGITCTRGYESEVNLVTSNTKYTRPYHRYRYVYNTDCYLFRGFLELYRIRHPTSVSITRNIDRRWFSKYAVFLLQIDLPSYCYLCDYG